MKRHLLLLMLLLLSVASIGLNNTYATTANQQNSENLTNDNFSSLNTTYIQNTTNIQNTTSGSANASTVVSNTSKSPVNTTNSTESATNSTSNSDNSNGSATIQNTTEAAGDGSYNKIHGIWLSTDDVNNVSVDELKESGITDIFVKANRISVPTYQSVLKTVLEKFKDSGIRVNAWITCFVDSNGKWIDPQSTNGTKTINDILNQVTDITTNYNIDGIHLDYVRYPGTAYKHAGGTETITNFVKQVYETVKSINKNVAVSAALMPECGDNAYNYGQNYTALSSYLDFLVPMIYKGNYKGNTTWISKTTAYIVSHANGKPVVAGIQTYSSDDNLTVLPASEIIGDINSAVSNGSSGYVLFRYGWLDKDFFTNSSSNNGTVNTTSTSGTTSTGSNATSTGSNATGTSGTTANATGSNAAGTSNGTSSSGTVSGAVSFTVAQIGDAASRVKAYVEANKKLPAYVTIGVTQVEMPEFLRLLTGGLLQVSSGSKASVTLKNESAALNPVDSVKSGNIKKTEYVSMAKAIKSFMDSYGKAPNYASSSLGKIQYQSLVYMYSRIMGYYSVNKVLPTYAAIKPWSNYTATTKNTTNTSGTTSNGTVSGAVSFTVAQIGDAASRVKAYVEANKKLPAYVTIGVTQVEMPEFLRLLTGGLLQVSSGSKASVTLKNESAALNPVDSVKSGNIKKTEYVSMAKAIKSFMDSYGKAPNYASSSLGKIQYQSLVYMYSRIMGYYSVNKVLPTYAAIKPWSNYTATTKNTTNTNTTIPASLQQYLKATTNCQSTNAQIIALSKSIISNANATTTYNKAAAIFNWVRDNIGYSFYSNTDYGAVGTLKAKTGNCVDTSHLLIALERAAGIPARYEHGYCKFSTKWYGHVWAQVYVNGKWYNADAISYRNTFGVINNWNTATVKIYGTYATLPF